VFNARHFVTYWGDGRIDMNSAEFELVNITRDKKTGLYIPKGSAEIVFPNINKRVVTVYIDALFKDSHESNTQLFQINYGSEEHSNRTTAGFNVIIGVEESKYVVLHTSGKVSHIRLIVDANEDVAIRGITLNKPVPLKISLPRVLLFSTIAFCIVVIIRKKLFSLPLKSDSRGQNILTAGIMLVFIAYLFMLMMLALPFSFEWPFMENFTYDPVDQYNVEIVDAILDGHAYLDIEPSRKFLELTNPYDFTERNEAKVNAPWGAAYYNEKFYYYYGIVPVLLLSLPAKLITGRYISTRVSVFIFAALASIFLMLIWRRMVFRYMKKMPLGMYALGQLTVAMCSMLPFLTVSPSFYEVSIASALFFTALGLWLLLGNPARKYPRWVEIASGSLCMALAVGCRENYFFFLLLIPVVLFEELKRLWNSKKQFLGLCACVAVPYTLVVCGLMWYNYIRFGSVLEFGYDYLITFFNMKARHLISPMAKLAKIFIGFFCYLVPSFDIRASFPFVYLKSIDTGLAYLFYFYATPVFGLIALPVAWFVSGIGTVKQVIGKQRKPTFYFLAAMICLGFLQILIVVLSDTIVNRYTVDFFWLFVLSGLFCAYFIYRGMVEYQERIMQLQQRVMLNRVVWKLKFRDDFCIKRAFLLAKRRQAKDPEILKSVSGFSPRKLKEFRSRFILREIAKKVIVAIMIISVLLMFLVTLSGNGEGSLIWGNNPDILYSIQRLLGFNTW
jgi:ABC-type multidrug transport system fused ATPase/permease subunit